MDEQIIKIGRWEYPIRVTGSSVLRNEKRDGSGSWVEVTSKQMPFDQQKALVKDVIAARRAETGDDTPEVPESEDYHLLKQIYQHVFDSFSTDYDEIADQFGLRVGRAKAAVSRLAKYHMVWTDKRLSGPGGKTEIIVQSRITYDDISQFEALANFTEAVPNDVKIPNPSTHGGVKGAQVNKPGKSTWKIGDKCPQGKHTLNDRNLYRMPSGRCICRDCRDSYKSVQERKAGTK